MPAVSRSGVIAAYAAPMPAATGVVAAGHSLTAEAGAQVLREGGNAVDAAICAVLTSFVTESQLSGFGAGGFMMVHEDGEDSLTDFFVAAGGADGAERKEPQDPSDRRRGGDEIGLADAERDDVLHRRGNIEEAPDARRRDGVDAGGDEAAHWRSLKRR